MARASGGQHDLEYCVSITHAKDIKTKKKIAKFLSSAKLISWTSQINVQRLTWALCMCAYVNELPLRIFSSFTILHRSRAASFIRRELFSSSLADTANVSSTFHLSHWGRRWQSSLLVTLFVRSFIFAAQSLRIISIVSLLYFSFRLVFFFARKIYSNESCSQERIWHVRANWKENTLACCAALLLCRPTSFWHNLF